MVREREREREVATQHRIKPDKRKRGAEERVRNGLLVSKYQPCSLSL